MKILNIVVSDKAHDVLKVLTAKHKKNQSEIVSEMLESQYKGGEK